MKWIKSLRSEFVKTKRTASLYGCILLAVLLPLLRLLDMVDDPEAVALLQKDPWNLYYRGAYQQFSLFLLPVVIGVGTLLPQIEYRNHTWRQVLTAPAPLPQIYLSKFLVMQLLLLLFVVVYHLLMAASGVALALIRPELSFFDHVFPLRSWAAAANRAYVAALAFSAVQYWLGMHFKNFIVPIVTGVCLWISAGMFLFELEVGFIEWYPFAYPLLNLVPAFQGNAVSLQWASVGFALFFLALGFADFSRRKGLYA